MKLLKNPQIYIWAVLILLPAQVYAVFAMRAIDMAFWVDQIAHPSAASAPMASGAWKLWIVSIAVDVALLMAASVLVKGSGKVER